MFEIYWLSVFILLTMLISSWNHSGTATVIRSLCADIGALFSGRNLPFVDKILGLLPDQFLHPGGTSDFPFCSVFSGQENNRSPACLAGVTLQCAVCRTSACGIQDLSKRGAGIEADKRHHTKSRTLKI